jgi:hypothetical protein
MQTASSKLRLRALVGVVALVVVVAAIWATAALAGGGSSGSESSEANESPAAAFVQDRGEGSAEDCPEHEDEGEENADPSSNL